MCDRDTHIISFITVITHTNKCQTQLMPVCHRLILVWCGGTVIRNVANISHFTGSWQLLQINQNNSNSIIVLLSVAKITLLCSFDCHHNKTPQTALYQSWITLPWTWPTTSPISSPPPSSPPHTTEFTKCRFTEADWTTHRLNMVTNKIIPTKKTRFRLQ